MALSKELFLSGKRIVISGGTGFIGSHLLSQILKQHPSDVLIVSRGSSTERIQQYLSRIMLKVYRSSTEFSNHIIKFDPDYLFLLGGNADPRISLSDPKSDLTHNLLYNFELLERLRRKKNTKTKIIFVSSVAVYGENEKGVLKEDSPTMPKSPYGINKLAVEGYIRFFSEMYGIKGFSVRLFSTYGPGLYKQVVYDFIKELLQNHKLLTIRGDGAEVRDLSYIDDQISGLLLLGKRASYKGEVYNLGSGTEISIKDLASTIAKLMKLTPRITYQKKTKEKHHGKIWVADITKVKRLGHNPQITIPEGLKKTIKWVKNV